MALELGLSFLEANDNTGLQLTDATGETTTGTTTGWGVVSGEAPTPATDLYTDIITSGTATAEKWHLKLDVVYTGSDGTEITYDQLDLFDLDTTGAFAVVGDLLWVLEPSDLVSDGTEMGSSGDEFLDGIYEFTYSLLDAPTDVIIEDSLVTSILVDGKVRVKTYDVIREIASIYNCTNEEEPIYNPKYRDILVALLKYGMFSSMIANVSYGNVTEVLNILDTLERLTIND